MLRLDRLAQNIEVVDANRRPSSAFLIYWQRLVSQLERAIQLIVQLTGIQDQFDEALKAAQAATKEAQDAADAAKDAADAAQAQTDATKREAALQSSYITPASVLTATPTTITIAAHTRYYSDGTSAAVNAGTTAATAADDVDYVSYVDPARAGGAVTYIVSTTAPVQTGDTHVVGAVQIPAAGTADGGEGPQRPGYVRPRTLPEA